MGSLNGDSTVLQSTFWNAFALAPGVVNFVIC